MTWVVWRQHRMEALAVSGVLAGIALLLLVTGLHLRSEYDSLGVASCLVPGVSSSACTDVIRTFSNEATGLAGWVAWLNLVPGLIGVFIGAPLLARELERGTHQVAWTQGVSRTRWIVVKLAVLAVGACVAALVFAALMTWWHGPVDSTASRLEGQSFDLEGLVPIAYTLFAFALGTLAGTVLRRTVVAMGVTMGGFLAVRLPIANVLRQRYVPALTGTQPMTPGSGDWLLSETLVDRGGHSVTPDQVFAACPAFKSPGGSPAACLNEHFLTLVTYQPAGRFWTFQVIESGIFLALAVAMLSAVVYWVRRVV